MAQNKTTKPAKAEFIRTPFPIIKAPGDWSLLEASIIINVSAQLQGRYDDDSGLYYDLLFNDREFVNGEAEIRIPVKDLGLNSKHYKDIDSACKRLASINVPVEETDEDGKTFQFYRPLITPGFDITILDEAKKEAFDMMTEEERAELSRPWMSGAMHGKFIKVKVHESVAKKYFRKQSFAVHLRNITQNCKSARTPRIYLFLSKFRDWKGETTIKYEDLKTMLCTTSADRDKAKVDPNDGQYKMMYARYKDFNKRVLMPAKEELDALYQQGLVDLTFDYEAIRPIGKDGKRKDKGEPESIHFTIIKDKDENMIKALTKALAPAEVEVRDKFKALLKDMGVEHIEGIEPITMDFSGCPTFLCKDEKSWNDFYRSNTTAQFWTKHFGQRPGKPEFEAEEVSNAKH